MSPAKKKNYSDPSLEELLRDMPDDSCAVRDYGDMQNEIARLEDQVRDLESFLSEVSKDLRNIHKRVDFFLF